MSLLKKEILQHLLYAEIFNHPVKAREISFFLTQNSDDFQSIIDELEKDQLVIKTDDFYFIHPNADKIPKRIKGNQKAEKLTPKAHKTAQFIGAFPFVEGVGISGSLSKGVLHSDADFDFFIVTQPNRLWVARTLLILYKKIFLLNSRKYFCVNYFVDSNNLEIEEKNRFTAMEVATLIPAYGGIFKDFYRENQWVENYFPIQNKNYPSSKNQKGITSHLITQLLSKNLGEKMDTFLMRTTLKRWQKKFGKFDDRKFDLTMKTRRYVSKHHPSDFQSKVLSKYHDIVEQYKSTHHINLAKHNIEL